METGSPGSGAQWGIDRRTALLGVGSAIVASAIPLVDVAHALPARDTAGPDPRTTASLTASVADYAVASSFSALPAPVVERTKKVIFDELAAAWFGQRTDAAKIAGRYVAEVTGRREARIYGTDRRASIAFAAMVNGTAGHGEEVDGTHVIGGHPGASIVHAATATAERQGTNGAELINAVALGYDVGTRLVQACGGKFTVRDRKHLTSDFLYALGCTAAAGRLLRLEPSRHRHALALTTFQANGLYALYDEKRHISKSFCNGQYAYAGISAALMAQAGLEGNEDIIGGNEGLLQAWGDGQDRQAVTRGLGTEFKILGANFKFFNAGQPIHTAVEAAMTLVRQHRIAGDDIAGILVGMPQGALRTVDNREMHNISVQDMVSATLAKGGLSLADQPFPAILSDPTYKRLRALIVASIDPEIQREFPNGRGARVTITTRNGQRYTLRIDNPRGHSLRGEVTWDDLIDKWHDSLPGCDVAAAVAVARNMETLAKATTLFDALRGVNRMSAQPSTITPSV